MLEKLITKIRITWCIEDVMSVRPDLSRKQASHILQRLKRNHDAGIGINWEIIKVLCDIEFPIKEDDDHEMQNK